ncbi:unnamed protein product [Rotaria socialis]|uniref:UDP-N-acetylglucosamine--peptide N-acetylglucosaminyltransferase SPINDLY n=1 Tax=Rotaria socialis TaxID=392032 RepID=A0A820FXZ5_9BILA|nr:unnamed protein product [Rotaria socialis]CAF4268773.1 unnamed protein product [Rotaria socialis]
MVDLPSVKQSYTMTTTGELKSRAFKSSMGVLPFRRSESIPELNLVHLRGRSVMATGVATTELASSRVGTNTPVTPRPPLALSESVQASLSDRYEPLPAILPMVGTAHSAALLERRSQKKPTVNVPPVKKRKVEILIVEPEVIQRSTPRSVVGRMVNEARLLSQPGGDRLTPHSRLSSKQQSYGTSSTMSSTHPQQIVITPSDDPSRAAVENLIASIKSKQLQEAQRQSDRKILDIIHRVLGRTIDLVYDEDEKEQIQQEHEQKLIVDEEKRIPMILEEEDMSVHLRVPDVSRMDLEVDDEKYEGEDGEYEGITDKERTLRTKKQTEDYEQIDMSRDPLYRHILLGITDEDLLNVRGTQINVPTSLISRNRAIPTKPAKHDDKSVHHFCIQMTNESDILSKELRAITQLYHQRARYRNKLPTSTIYYKHGQLPKPFIKETIGNERHEDEQNISRSIKTNGPSIPYDGLEPVETDLNVWQRRATQIVQPKIEGNSAISQDPYLIHLWTPAPPKMYIHPRRVKERLFVEYTSNQTKEFIDMDDDDMTLIDEQKSVFTNFSEVDQMLEVPYVVPVIKRYKSLERLPSTIDHSDEFRMSSNMIRSSRSCSNLTSELTLRLDTNYVFTLDETKHQIAARKHVKPETITSNTVPSDETHLVSSQIIEVAAVKEQQESIVEEKVEQSSGDFQYFRKTHHAVHYEDAVADGRQFISTARMRATRRSRKDVRFWERIDAIVALATAPPRDPPISRRQSFHEAHFYERNHPHLIKEKFRKRRTSLEKEKLNFDKNIKTKYKYEETRTKFGGKRLLNEFEWTREVWYIWLDEYIAELDKIEIMRQEKEVKQQQQIAASTPLDEPSTFAIDDSEHEISGSQIKKVSTSVQLEPIINLQVPHSEERRLIEDELYRLTKLIDRDPRDVFSLTRRGGLLRKLGLFHDALNDLSLAVYIEPSFMDAYWQRALIYMIFEHYDDALDSLNMCIKFNKTHAGAYKLRGDIYSMRNDLALAIANYSQAIRHNSTDHESYFQRAQTYERRNEILLAMDDYVQVTQLNPKNIEAWYKHALYYFNTNNYDYAVGDFTELLKREPDHVTARLYRGLSYFYLEYYQNALADFSATLHYDPSNWAAYYHRGCLLRTCNPAKSLKDLSISLLINPEYENVGAYLHRALIYCKQNQYDAAIADYEAVLVLDREHAPALCNLAIIYMRTNVQKALQLFTRAIEAEPTYVRAYFCRAYFYTQINKLQQAYSDYTKIYHMFPDQNGAMVLRGNILLLMGKLDLASFCVEVAAKLQSLAAPEEDGSPSVSSSMKMSASSPQQQAIVHSFLEQFDYALSIIERECLLRPTPANYRMFGRLRTKAKRFDEARAAFEKCIQTCISSISDQSVELHGAYLDLSKCLIQLQRYPQAVEQLTTLIKLQPPNQNAEAYLQRGIAKMRMFGKFSTQELTKLSSNRRPLLDINRALVIEPNSAEAYLARAAWYARCERYSKGVLNCNEAIRLNPKLVRAYLYRGCLKYSIRLYDHAIKDLSIALDIDPSCSHAYYNRALCYIRRGNLSLALKDFAIVLCLASAIKNSKTQLLELETYINRGLLQYEHKDFENALIDFEYALEIVTASNDERRINVLKHKLIYTIGQCHHRLAQFDEAIERFKSSEIDYHAMIDTTYRHDLWIAQGIVYMDMGNDESKLQATKLFESVLHENPIHETARLNLGYCFRQRGYYKRAWIQFSALLHFNPSNVRALEARAIVCLQMNHPTEAFIDLNQALRFQPSSAQLLTNRGVVQQYLGDNKNAMCDYRAAMLADPNNAFAHYNAGNVLMFHGQFLEAITLFDRVLEINPRDEAALTNRAIAKVVLKQYSGARSDLEHALRISPLSAHIHIDLGQLLLTMNEPIEAEKHFTRALEIRPCDPVVYKWRGDALSKQDGRRQDALDNYRACVELSDALQLARKHGLIKAPTKTRRRL